MYLKNLLLSAIKEGYSEQLLTAMADAFSEMNTREYEKNKNSYTSTTSVYNKLAVDLYSVRNKFRELNK